MPKPSSDKDAAKPIARGARTVSISFLILSLALFLAACSGSTTSNSGASATPAAVASPSPQSSPARLAVDADRAFEHVRKQVEFGPRPAGSAELAKTRDYIVGELKSYGLNVTLDEFTPKTPVGNRKMVNVVAELPGESTDIIILSSHYDTKPFKDFNFVGANDGASSTAALLEIARVMAQNKQKPRLTYRFVFFDGEEAFCEEWDECKNPDGPDNTYGSRHYVQLLKEKNETNRVRALILLDMMGYKNLQLGRNEVLSTPWLINAVWDTAREMNYDKYFVDQIEHCDGDDHEPFLKAGIPSLDIIQLGTYPYWHTAEDTLDKISPQSLKTVADVVLASLPQIEQRILSMRPTS